MLGWFKLHRCLMEKPIFDNPKMLKVFIWCLFKATHKDRDVYFGLRKVALKPGQFITGRFSASEELKMNGSTAWLYLKTLQDNGTIELNSNNKYTVVNVVNWADYQVQTDSNEQQNDNKISTEYQQNITNKNVKNEKNVKKKDSMSGKYPDGSIEDKLSKIMKAKILESYPGAVTPKTESQWRGWCKSFDHLMRLDGRSEQDILKLMDWVYQDEFWMTNIRSPAKLRIQWDTLWLRMNGGKTAKPKSQEVFL